MITPRSIYHTIEGQLEPAWGFMVVLGLLIVAVTLFLIWKRNPAWLAAWLVYMFMP